MADADTSLTVGQRCSRFLQCHWHGLFTLVVPLLSSPMLFMEPQKQFYCAFVLVVMACYWLTEVIPLPVTSFIPIVAFPVMGILSSADVCFTYFKDALILFFGGLVVALAIEYCNLHKRVALSVILFVGCSPKKLHLSLMVVTMFISMWISNTATTAMMCPVIKAVLSELESQGMVKLVSSEKPLNEDDPPIPSKTVVCFYMGIAYASSAGGIGTLIGTGTNLVYKGIYDTRFPEAQDLQFLNFMVFTCPIMLLQTILMFLVLQWQYMGLFRPNSEAASEMQVSKEAEHAAGEVVKKKKAELGELTCHEIQVGILFLLMVVLFLTRKPGFFTGWADIMNAKAIKSSFPVIVDFVLLCMLPTNYIFLKYCWCSRPEKEGTRPSLITWPFIQKNMPWGMLFLLGGGFALSEGITKSGFAVMVGNSLHILESLPPPLVQFLVIIFAVLATAFTANMAMCNIIIPVLMEIAIIIRVHPMYLGLPATLALSFAFHLPVSTPANAVAGAFANIRNKDMAVAGIGPTIISTVLLFIFSQTWASFAFKGYTEFPAWAK